VDSDCGIVVVVAASVVLVGGNVVVVTSSVVLVGELVLFVEVVLALSSSPPQLTNVNAATTHPIARRLPIVTTSP
jgi:hypothetical protein